MITRGGEQYLDARHASEFLGISRTWFYEMYRDYLEAHKFGRHKRKYYRVFDLEMLRDSHEVIEPAA